MLPLIQIADYLSMRNLTHAVGAANIITILATQQG